MTAEDFTEVQPGDELEVFDAELEPFDAPPPAPTVQVVMDVVAYPSDRRAVVPWSSRQQLAEHARHRTKKAAHVVAFHVVRSPKYAAKVAVIRTPVGAWRMAKGLVDWLTVADARDHIRSATRQEWKDLTAQRDKTAQRRQAIFWKAALPVTLAGLVVLVFLATTTVLICTLICLAAVAALVGGRGIQVTDRATEPSGMPDETKIRHAFARALKFRDDAEPVRVVGAGPRKVQGGTEFTVELPYGSKTPSDAVLAAPVIAHNLDHDPDTVIVETVRGKGRQVKVWMVDGDPYDRPASVTPFARLEPVSIWEPFRVGLDLRQQEVLLSLMWTSLLIGANPRMGKSFSMRLVGLACALDPYTKPSFFDFKPQGDWSPLRPVARQFGEDDSDEGIREFAEWLAHLRHEEMPRRRKVLVGMDAERNPEGKLTPELCRDFSLGLQPMPQFVDEIQVPMGHRKYGKQIQEDTADIARRGPAVGVAVIGGTQKPGSNALPPDIRDVFSTRWALFCGNRHVSEAVLGESTKDGFDASKLPADVPGSSILTGQGAVTGACRFRADLADARVATAIVKRGVELRRALAPLAAAAEQGDRDSILVRCLAQWPGDGKNASTEALARAVGLSKDVLRRQLAEFGVAEQKSVWFQGSAPQGYKREHLDAALGRS